MKKSEKLLNQFIRIKLKHNTYKVIIQNDEGVYLDAKFYLLTDILKAILIVNPEFSL